MNRRPLKSIGPGGGRKRSQKVQQGNAFAVFKERGNLRSDLREKVFDDLIALGHGSVNSLADALIVAYELQRLALDGPLQFCSIDQHRWWPLRAEIPCLDLEVELSCGSVFECDFDANFI